MSNVDSSELYCEITGLPYYTGAQFVAPATSSDDTNKSSVSVRVTSVVVDHLRNVRRSTVKHIIATDSGPFGTPAQDASDAVLSFVSPSGNLLAVLRETSGNNGEQKRFIEVWKGGAFLATTEVTKMHGAFYTDVVFASLSFSPSESSFCYTAEENPPETEEDDKPYDKMRFRPLLGETYREKKRPANFIVQWGEEIYQAKKANFKSKDSPSRAVRSTIVKKLTYPELLGTPVFGQVVFYSDTILYATGYERTADDRFLGLYACGNRPSGIWVITLPSNGNNASPDEKEEKKDVLEVISAKKLTKEDRACRSPRIVKDKLLVWLSNEIGGPHLSCSRLDSLEVVTGEQRIVVDAMSKPMLLSSSASSASENQLFCGLFVDQLPFQSILVLKGESFILTHSTCTHYNTLFLISLTDGKVRRLKLDDGELQYSWLAFCTDGQNRFICRKNKLNSPGELFLGTILDPDSPPTLRSLDKTKPSPKLEKLLAEITIDIIHKRDHVETIVVHSSGMDTENPKPCILWPHGGPHGVSTIEYVPYITYVLAGYTFAMPNYTGSIGYGEKNVKALIGKCGTLDVKDCVDAVEQLVQRGFAKYGKGCLFVYGGSHGGFLAGHLVGQYPSMFSAAVMNNPVTAAGDMIATTDIPDWCYSEFGFSYPPVNGMETDDGEVKSKFASYATLQDASPIAHVDSVETPVLLLVGEQDQRVPPSQGRNYYHALRERKKVVDMLTFPGNGHSLEQVESSRLAFEAARDWFGKYR